MTTFSGLAPTPAPIQDSSDTISCNVGSVWDPFSSYPGSYSSQPFTGSFSGDGAYFCVQYCDTGMAVWDKMLATSNLTALGYTQVYTCNTSNCNDFPQFCRSPLPTTAPTPPRIPTAAGPNSIPTTAAPTVPIGTKVSFTCPAFKNPLVKEYCSIQNVCPGTTIIATTCAGTPLSNTYLRLIDSIGLPVSYGVYNSGLNGYPSCIDGRYLKYTSTQPQCGTFTLEQELISYVALYGNENVVTVGKLLSSPFFFVFSYSSYGCFMIVTTNILFYFCGVS